MAVTIQIPIDLRNPGITTDPGNSWWTVSAFTAPDFGHWEYIKDLDGSVFGMVAVPQNMAATPNAKVILYVSHPAATTGEVTKMQVFANPVADTEAIPTSMTSVDVVDFTVTNTADVIEKITFPATGSMTAPVAGDQMFVEVFHNGDSAGGGAADTLTENTRLHAAYLQIDVV